MNYKDKFVGIRIFGFCNGYFGRDAYEDKTIVASGQDWVVATTDDGKSQFASFDTFDDMEELIGDWSKQDRDW